MNVLFHAEVVNSLGDVTVTVAQNVLENTKNSGPVIRRNAQFGQNGALLKNVASHVVVVAKPEVAHVSVVSPIYSDVLMSSCFGALLLRCAFCFCACAPLFSIIYGI